MVNDITELQKSYDLFFAEVIRKCKFFLFNPINLSEEKKKFMKDKTYSPQFKYLQLPEVNEMYGNILESMNLNVKSGSQEINGMLLDKFVDLKKKIKLTKSLGKSSFTKNSISIYGKPSKKLVNEALKILKKDFIHKRRKYISSDKCNEELKSNFRDLGMKRWKIVKADLANSAAISCESRTLKLRKRERMQKSFIERLKIHEIGTHALRFENGRMQPLKIMKLGLANYLETEEGLAVYSEDMAGVLSESIKRNYAGRVLAISLALEGGFPHVYENLLPYFKSETAFKLAVRAKRGLADSSKPGGFTKDCLYLRGYYKVKKYAENNDISSLYVGKIGIKDVDKLRRISIIQKPKFLPDFILNK